MAISTDFDSALREYENQQEASTDVKSWIRQRIDRINHAVSAHDILRRQGVALRYSGSEHEEQFACPFHGVDTKPSARVYPSDATSASHAYCYVCQERWDTITLWKKYNGLEEDKFTNILRSIEQAYGLPAIAPPTTLGNNRIAGKKNVIEDKELAHTMSMLTLCENRLRRAKPLFEMRGYFIIGQILDRIDFQLRNKLISLSAARGTLQKIVDKIGEKERA